MEPQRDEFEGGSKVIEYLGERIILDQSVDTKRKAYRQYDDDAQRQRKQHELNMERKAHMHNRFFKKMK